MVNLQDPISVDALTLADIAALLKERLPAHLMPFAAQTFKRLACSLLTTETGTLYFVRSRLPSPRAIDRLVKRGATFFVARKEVTDSSGTTHPTLLVRNPEEAFIQLCSSISRSQPARKIAVTGSIGKTTLKEMVRLVAEEQFITLFSRGNQNGVSQVGRYIQKLTPDVEVYVQETGAGSPGLVRADARMLAPDAFVVSNVGLNHAGAYGSRQDNILADKLSPDFFLPEDGVVFLNYDDPLLREATLEHRRIFYSADNPAADYYAKNLVMAEGKLNFDVVESSTDRSQPVELTTFGKHNVENAVGAFAIGRWLGVDPEKITAGLARYRGEGLRQNLMTVGGQKILVDCYNASEMSALSLSEALPTITPGPAGRRLLVFGDIDDKLGSHTEEVHRRVGRHLAAAEGIDEIFTVGPHSRWAYEEMQAAGRKSQHAEDRAELRDQIERVLTKDDVIAFKGGQQMALSITIDELFGTALILLDGDVLQKRGRTFIEDGLEFRRIRGYGVQLLKIPRRFGGGRVVVPPAAGGDPVYLVGAAAGSRSNIESLRVSEPVRALGSSAFFNCRNLKEVHLPSSLRTIGRSAFNNCHALKEIHIPGGVTSLGDRVFYRCENLERVTIPGSVTELGEDIFTFAPQVCVFGLAGSEAERYCKAHDVSFVATG